MRTDITLAVTGKGVLFDGQATFFSHRGALKLTGKALYLYHYMDGETPDRLVIEKFNKRFNEDLRPAQLRRFVAELARNKLLFGRVNGFLCGKAAPVYRRILQEEFEKMQHREPAFAGPCYKRSKAALLRQLEGSFGAVRDERLDFLLRGQHPIRGLLAPHSNMELCGTCAAWGYRAVSRHSLPHTCVILGPSHFVDLPQFCLLEKKFRTPLGKVEIDSVFAENLTQACRLNITNNTWIHLAEHSIEMHLPYLQYVYRGGATTLRIVPVLCPPDPRPADLASFVQALRYACSRCQGPVLIIASSDLTHAGWRHDISFHARNRKILGYLREGSASSLHRHISTREYRMCGKQAVITALQALRPCRGTTLNYSWSGKTTACCRDRSKSIYADPLQIGYASVVFS